MAKEFRVTTLILSGASMSINANDHVGFWRHDGLYADPLSGNPSGFLQSFLTGSLYSNSNSGSYISTGNADARYYSISNPSGYVMSSQTGNQVDKGMTGLFYAASNPNSYISTGNADARYVSPAQTGSFITINDSRNLNLGGEISYSGPQRQIISLNPSTLSPSFYPNITFNEWNNSVTGALVVNTQIPRDSNCMFSIRVHGFAYGDASVIDMNFVGYAYNGISGNLDNVAGAVTSIGCSDQSTFGYSKFIGINQSGKVAIAIGTTGLSSYFYRLAVDATITRFAGDLSTGWNIQLTTGSGFGWVDTHQLSSIVEYHDHNAAQISIGILPSGRLVGSYAGITSLGLSSLSVAGTSALGVITTSSSGIVTNLNADLIDGLNSTAFALASQTGSFITTPQTGNFVDKGMTGNFVDRGQTGLFVTSNNTGSFITNSQTGQFYPNSNPNSYISTGNADLRYYGVSNPSGYLTTAVTSLVGTANQVNVSATTGSVTLSLPQSIATTSTPTFSGIVSTNQIVVWSQTTGANFNNGAIQVREVQQNSTGSFDLNYAPRITFHWGNVTANSIALGNDGKFNFNSQNNASGYTDVKASTFWSQAPSGTVPFVVLSNRLVTNLNSDLLDGLDSSAFALASQTGNFVSTLQTGNLVDRGMTGSFINVAQTGGFYSNSNSGSYISTGSADARYYSIANPNQYISTGNGDIRYALASNTGSFITNSQTGIFATISNLNSSGSNLQSQINILDSWTGLSSSLYYPLNSNPNGYTLNSQTGQFYPNSNPNQYISTGNADARYVSPAQTGNLVDKGMTGKFLSSGTDITIGNLISQKHGTGAGIYTFSKTIASSGSNNIFSIYTTFGALSLQASIIDMVSGVSISKSFVVAHSLGGRPFVTMGSNSGPYSGSDFGTNFFDTGSSGVALSVFNNSPIISNFLVTVFLGGSFYPMVINEL